MKPLLKFRLKPFYPALLWLIALPVAAEFEITGQLQQEYVNWSSAAIHLSGKQVGDGAVYITDTNRHDQYGASSITLKGSRNLRRDYRAVGAVGFDLDINHTADLQDGEAWLGFSSTQSLWRFGRMASPYRDATQSWDPFDATFLQARGNGGLSLSHHSGYLQNSLAYQSNWWGVDLDFAWAMDQQDENQDGETDGDDTLALALTKAMGGWTLALAREDDQRSDRQASKFGARFGHDSWQYQLQYERLEAADDYGYDALFNLIWHSDLTQVAFSVGKTDAPSEFAAQLNYYALGMKYAFTSDTIFHIGYRTTRTDASPNNNERAVGMGLRFLF
ncbi:MAG: porin [Gammaproteobacteria bacterium]|nr:porin [Gammaproteobacteria bacterium]